ncbi:MAG: hypothetical protein IID37_08240 [Planctomycetes bacterium]|nr:hypothetical protein [Planctomycetota bacterium]
MPGPDDRVFIQSGQTWNGDISDSIDTLDVASTGELVIETGRVLTLKGEFDEGSSTIAGNIKLEGSGCELAIEQHDQTLTGNGTITGHNSAAAISVTGQFVDLVNEITIHGTLVINGNGIFHNQGTVKADGGTVLHVNSGQVDDTSGATWAAGTTLATICGGCLATTSTLRFNVPLVFGQTAHLLAGDFTVTRGQLDVHVSFKTTGQVTHNSGTINVDSAASCTFDD